jgi:hypothetical protein
MSIVMCATDLSSDSSTAVVSKAAGISRLAPVGKELS